MSELRDLLDEVQTLLRTARGALTLDDDPLAVTDLPRVIAEARAAADQAIRRIDRGLVAGVVPR